ncbi:MAG: hypothetical protein HY584_04535 [Candidatus Omnitrophica bacterium]|nr:hypothetical protein [Candidatus Omnitrophota bacterium]
MSEAISNLPDGKTGIASPAKILGGQVGLFTRLLCLRSGTASLCGRLAMTHIHITFAKFFLRYH